MPDLSKEFLHRILKSIPEHQRLEFLEEVMATMEPDSIQRLTGRTRVPEPEVDDVMAGIIGADTPQTMPQPPETTPEPSKAMPDPIMAKIETGIPEPARRRAPIEKAEPANPQLSAEEQFRQIMAQHSHEKGGKDDMKKEMASCFLYGLGAVALFIVVTIGGVKLVDWIKTMF